MECFIGIFFIMNIAIICIALFATILGLGLICLLTGGVSVESHVKVRVGGFKWVIGRVNEEANTVGRGDTL